jgi:hypothetical protein
MEATAHLKKIITDLFESKKVFELKFNELQEEYDDLEEDELTGDKGKKLEDDIEALDEIIDQHDELILKIKEVYELE